MVGTGSCKIWGNGNLTCTGTKNALVNTTDYGWRKLYATEGTTNVFTDEGRVSLANGTATVAIDPIFLETITGEYDVSLTAYGGDFVYVAERNANNFVIRSSNPASSEQVFWVIHGKRKGYEQYRLEAWENG